MNRGDATLRIGAAMAWVALGPAEAAKRQTVLEALAMTLQLTGGLLSAARFDALTLEMANAMDRAVSEELASRQADTTAATPVAGTRKPLCPCQRPDCAYNAALNDAAAAAVTSKPVEGKQ